MFALPENYECLDSSRPWLCYWLCQSLALLNCELSSEEKSNVVSFLSKYILLINTILKITVDFDYSYILGVNTSLVVFVVVLINCHI